ncbi:HAD-IA family hydrolase [Paenibacillus hunanensis]|uniref:HAD-IA family hydrolase n=1 Tax=Paenibacillus hunanensis TaxID=539262 RepID=UPI002026D6CE|nr:HAD-IA family hydrolase [Paenibacillus hunanensis]MCL9659176.1 HAD-IA family hydrolase [Paenibacillus hunanensis]
MREGSTIYEVEPWVIRETSFNPQYNRRSETVFTVANGYIGMRGHFEEGMDVPEVDALNGTYLNGFYDSADIIYGEEAYGYARKRQTMLNVTDSKIIELWIEGERFNLMAGRIIDYERVLNMQTGILTRRMTWESGRGKCISICIERLVSFENKHMAMIRYTVKPLNFSGEITLVSALNGEVHNEISEGDPRAGAAFTGQVLETVGKVSERTRMALEQRTSETEFNLYCAADHRANRKYELKTEEQEQRIEKHFIFNLQQDQEAVLEKSIVYYTSRDYEPAHLPILAESTLDDMRKDGFNKLAQLQQDHLAAFWETADIQVEGDEKLQQGLRFNAFHLFQSVGRDGKTNIGAKGITGEGYEGHYFWDTETYIMPFFLYTQPELAHQLLEFRYHTLPKARERAVEMAALGALYPWRTIGGEEVSAYYPGGTAQYHINADVAHAVIQYAEATDDENFLQTKGLEMLVETCRFFLSVGDWIPGKGFCINGVTGPDEYTAIVNNNTYTNMMVKDQLEFTARKLKHWKENDFANYESLLGSPMGLTDEEIDVWERAADAIYIHRQSGLIGQDDSFLDKGIWDFENTPSDKYPLLLHYHPLVIYRHQVLKQADLILAMYLLGHRFTKIEKVRNYGYYEPLTTHDSSLSAAIHAIIAAELGTMDPAYEFFIQSARMDLDDFHNNVKDGIHAASMAGSWLTIVGGFAGMRQHNGILHFEPKLPPNWTRYSFRVQFQNRLLDITIEQNMTTYRIIRGEPLTISHYDEQRVVAMTRPLEIKNRTLKAVIFGLEGVLIPMPSMEDTSYAEAYTPDAIPEEESERTEQESQRAAHAEASLKRHNENESRKEAEAQAAADAEDKKNKEDEKTKQASLSSAPDPSAATRHAEAGQKESAGSSKKQLKKNDTSSKEAAKAQDAGAAAKGAEAPPAKKTVQADHIEAPILRVETMDVEQLKREFLLPGAEDLLIQLREQNVAVLLASDRPDARRIMERLGMEHYFSSFVQAQDITHPKPDPEGFILAAESVGIHPYHCMVIEDSPDCLQSVRQAGMKTIGVSLHHIMDNAHFTVASLEHLNAETMERWMEIP